MKILHTEASPGWGGQEIRILKESMGMQKRGHEIVFAVQKGSGLAENAKKHGFLVYELSFEKRNILFLFYSICKIIIKHKIDIINTHSSLDAWVGGAAGIATFRSILRTRHLSTPVKGKINAYLLYNSLADCVVTTCEASSLAIQNQAKLNSDRCISIPTGIEPLNVEEEEIKKFRKTYNLKEEDILVGTCCVLRGWKGVSDFLHAAKLLEPVPHLKWLVIGGGVSESYFKQQWKELNLEEKVIFTGHLSPPYAAIAALDLFLLLSWAHEGVSQASLQAAFLKKPLITTSIGGLPEVCLHEKTGIVVRPHSPEDVAYAVKLFIDNPHMRKKMGEAAHQLVCDRFTLTHTLNKMEHLYNKLK